MHNTHANLKRIREGGTAMHLLPLTLPWDSALHTLKKAKTEMIRTKAR